MNIVKKVSLSKCKCRCKPHAVSHQSYLFQSVQLQCCDLINLTLMGRWDWFNVVIHHIQGRKQACSFAHDTKLFDMTWCNHAATLKSSACCLDSQKKTDKNTKSLILKLSNISNTISKSVRWKNYLISYDILHKQSLLKGCKPV